jgi:hypothetical protein
MVSELPPEHLAMRAARGSRHARHRSRAPMVTLLLVMTCCLAVAGLVTKWRDPATTAGARAADVAPEPVVSRERTIPSLVLSNAGFEAGTEGWRPVSARLTRTTPGRDGEAAAKVAPGATTDSDEEGPGIRAFAVVGSIPIDTQVSVSVWVRSAQPGVTVMLKVIERQNDRSLGATSATRKLGGTGWQQLAVTHRVRTQGAAIDLLVAAPGSTTAFLVDTVAVRLERAPPPASPAPDAATDDTAPLFATG